MQKVQISTQDSGRLFHSVSLVYFLSSNQVTCDTPYLRLQKIRLPIRVLSRNIATSKFVHGPRIPAQTVCNVEKLRIKMGLSFWTRLASSNASFLKKHAVVALIGAAFGIINTDLGAAPLEAARPRASVRARSHLGGSLLVLVPGSSAARLHYPRVFAVVGPEASSTCRAASMAAGCASCCLLCKPAGDGLAL